MSMGYQQQPARRSGMTKAGKWMFIIGLVLSVITGIAVAWGAVQAAGFYSSLSDETSNLDGGTATVQMEEGDLRFVLAQDSAEAASCTVTGPDGTETPLSGDAELGDQPGSETEAEIIGSYSATNSGEHTFTCEGGSASLSPNLSGTAIAGTIVAAIGALALIPLGLLTLIGLILWLVGRGRDRKAQQNPPADWGYPGQQGPSQSQGYSSGQAYPAPTDSPYQQPGQSSPYQQPGQSSPYQQPGQSSPYQHPGQSSPYQQPGPEDDTRR